MVTLHDADDDYDWVDPKGQQKLQTFLPEQEWEGGYEDGGWFTCGDHKRRTKA